MDEKEQHPKEERMKGTIGRTIHDRRQSKILHHGLLDFDGQDKRSGVGRRTGKEKRIKSTYILE